MHVNVVQGRSYENFIHGNTLHENFQIYGNYYVCVCVCVCVCVYVCVVCTLLGGVRVVHDFPFVCNI